VVREAVEPLEALPRPGEVLDGKFRIEKVLGEGGMGAVLAAHHELLDQRVAIKILTSQNDKAVARFLLEARSTARLKSEHVARVMDVGTLPTGAPFIVLEYLEGCDLEELMRLHGRLPVREAVGYVLQALEGLAQAHALGMVHRDLKPANLFLAVLPNASNIIKIVDFGISKSIVSRDTDPAGKLTEENAPIGTPAFMAPEQIRAAKDVDPRSDIWSIGVVLYDLLTGAHPFVRDNAWETFALILEQDAPPLSSARPDVPPALSMVVARCMRRDRAQRYPSVLELARDLAPFGPEGSGARVNQIEQILRNAAVRAEPGRAEPVRAEAVEAARATPAPPDSAPPPSSRRPVPAPLVTGHVTFTSDTPRSRVIQATSPSLRKRVRRRAAVGGAVAGALVAALAVTGVVGMGRSAPPDSPVAAGPAAASAPAASLASTPWMPVPVRDTPAQAGPAPAAPPRARPAPRPPAAAPAPAPSSRSTTTNLPTRHLGVLDSPD
jgi:serine/threonine-protein kinase